ncbi:MAG: hypothetical protein JSW39_28675, partial [Desulfobacterales bacterium]
CPQSTENIHISNVFAIEGLRIVGLPYNFNNRAHGGFYDKYLKFKAKLLFFQFGIIPALFRS